MLKFSVYTGLTCHITATGTGVDGMTMDLDFTTQRSEAVTLILVALISSSLQIDQHQTAFSSTFPRLSKIPAKVVPRGFDGQPSRYMQINRKVDPCSTDLQC